MSTALSEAGEEEDEETIEDKINRIMEAQKAASERQLLRLYRNAQEQNAGDFRRAVTRNDGKTKHRPFHSYTMKQAIEEGFILDVLKSYTPVDSYYKLVKTVESDPEFDTKRAKKKLRRYVESHDHAIQLKGRNHGGSLP